MTAAVAPRVDAGPTRALRQAWSLSRRSLLAIVRQPQVVVPSMVFPLFFAALNSAAFDNITAQQPEFAQQFDSSLDFLLPATMLQGVLFASTQGGTEMANDIQMGFFDRLLASPVSRTSILVGRLAGCAALGAVQGLFFALVLGLFGATVDGIGPLVVFVVTAALMGTGIGGFGIFFGIRTGSTEAVQGTFPLIFVLMFTSSAFFPRELMTGWYRSVATYNPLSWILEALRDLNTLGWDAVDAVTAIGVALAMSALTISMSLAALRRRLREAA